MNCYSPAEIILNQLRDDHPCRIGLAQLSYWPSPGLSTYLLFFAGTVLTEALFAVPALKPAPWRKRALAILSANLLTHPLLVFAGPRVALELRIPVGALIFWAEMAIIPLAEGLIYFAFSRRFGASLLVAYAANFASWFGLAYAQIALR